MEALVSKDKVERWIVPHLSKGKRGNKTTPALCQVVLAIFYRLKTGCQWRQLPLKEFFEQGEISSWQGVYYHFSRWSKDGSFAKMWTALFGENHRHLDLSCVQLDGSHTSAKNGGAAVVYQSRKADKTANMLFLADNQNIMLACSAPQAGNNHDMYELPALFAELFDTLQRANIPAEGLFLNADAGFDCKVLRVDCEQRDIQTNIAKNKRKEPQAEDDNTFFDEKLYKRRIVIERANAWIDSFKALLVRFETITVTWTAMHLLAFSLIFIQKSTKTNNAKQLYYLQTLIQNK